MKQSSSIMKPVITGIIMAVLVAVVIRTVGQRKNQALRNKNPYEYDLTKLQKIDPKWFTYDELQPISLSLEKVKSLTVNSDNQIIVTGDSRVLVLDENGTHLFSFDLPSPATCITTGLDNTIYLVMKNRIAVYDFEGSKIAEWLIPNEKAIVTSIAVVGNHVFAADADRKIVFHFDRKGQFIGEIGRKNPTKDIPGFIVPSPYFDLAIGYEGLLWVVNPGRHTIENYTFDGDLRSSWGVTAYTLEGFSGCCNPTHIAILNDGGFVTSEKGLVRIKIYDQTGNLKAVAAGPDHFDKDTVGLDLAVDNIGRILVLDPKRKLIRIFVEK